LTPPPFPGLYWVMRSWTLAGTLALTLGVPTASAPQEEPSQTRYDYQYGTPEEVTVDDLLSMGATAYANRAVRTKGTLEMSNRLQGRMFGYALRGTFGGQVEIVPVGEVSFEFETEAKRWFGKEVQITGVVNQSTDTQGSLVLVQFWKYLGPPEQDVKAIQKANTVTLESLVLKPGGHDGQTVRVVGKFRGRNLYGDLPVRSQRNSSDWVIKDDIFAVWITGKKPKGPGFDLDPGLKRDTGKWVLVVGRPETSGSVTYLRALSVEVTTAPTPTAQAQPPPPPPERPKVPPVVVFSLPLDGDREVPTDGRFQVQFSKDMNEQTFNGRVILRYSGRTQPGDRGFDGAKLTYDGGRRTLTVEPGDVLRPGRQIELILLPGIVDIDGLALVARSGKPVGSAADVLRFQVVVGALAGGS
jgi:hypothetical protein